jgi:hypothetical protein
LVSANNETILKGEGYTSKQNCLNGINSVNENSPYDNRYERVIIFNKVGLNIICPLEFNFNGQKYISNQIGVNVQPKIVLEESLEIRIAELKEIKYIIIEQLVKNVAKTEANEFGNIITYLGGVPPENFEFTTIQENLGEKI